MKHCSKSIKSVSNSFISIWRSFHEYRTNAKSLDRHSAQWIRTHRKLAWRNPSCVAVSRTDGHLLFYCDLPCSNTTKKAADLRANTLDIAMTWLALGLDPSKTTLWAQQAVPEVCELSWVLSCMSTKAMLDKAHAFKDAVAKGKKTISAGLYTYPVLMAADILAFDTTVVPVGKDQVQHVEMARDMAKTFNHTFGETLVLPESVVQANVAAVPGLDGNKMSKSYGNTIEIFLPKKKLRKRIMAIQTDSKTMEEPKDPDDCLVFDYYKLFNKVEQADLAVNIDRYFGYGHAKQHFERINDLLRA